MPRLIRPTSEIEQPAPLTEEQHTQLNRVLGPGPQGQVHTLPEDFEEKRQAELEKMGVREYDRIVTEKMTGDPVEFREIVHNDNGAPEFALQQVEIDSREEELTQASIATEQSWKPDLRVTSAMGLKGETVTELAEEIRGRPPIADTSAGPQADAEEPDINAQLEEFFKDEKDIEERDPHIVPLEEQEAEEVEEEREAPRSLLQQVSRQVIEGRPWSNWADPMTATAPLHRFSLAAENDILSLVLQPEKRLATVTVEALAALGKRCGFPPEFVGKLSPELAAEVVNDRISVADNHDMTVLLQNGEWTAILPAWRGIVPFRVACDVVWDTLTLYYTGLLVDRLEANGSLHLRLLTPVIYPVTAEDALQMGVDLTFSYNTTITVSLLVRRKVDGSEMTAYPQSFSWRARTGDAGSAERQLEWLQNAVLYAIGMFVGFVEKAKELSEHRNGVTTTNDFNIPKKHLPKLREMGRMETVNEWKTVCILAQFALDYEGQIELQATLGDYVANWSE